jgi:hypothetical protein
VILVMLPSESSVIVPSLSPPNGFDPDAAVISPDNSCASATGLRDNSGTIEGIPLALAKMIATELTNIILLFEIIPFKLSTKL